MFWWCFQAFIDIVDKCVRICRRARGGRLVYGRQTRLQNGREPLPSSHHSTSFAGRPPAHPPFFTHPSTPPARPSFPPSSSSDVAQSQPQHHPGVPKYVCASCAPTSEPRVDAAAAQDPSRPMSNGPSRSRTQISSRSPSRSRRRPRRCAAPPRETGEPRPLTRMCLLLCLLAVLRATELGQS